MVITIIHRRYLIRQRLCFAKRALAKRYVCVYICATYIAVNVERSLKRTCILQSVFEDDSKEVLTYTVAPNESAYVWNELLLDVKERGVEEVLFCCSSPAD